MIEAQSECRYESGKPPLEGFNAFLPGSEAVVDLDRCICDFVVRRHDGTVTLRQRRGAFASGRRLVREETVRFPDAGGGVNFDPLAMPRLDFNEPLPPEVARAREPVPGGWEEKLKNGLIAAVTQSVATMFCHGLQHAVADKVLEGIVDRWRGDFRNRDLVERGAEMAVRISHLALGHFIGTFLHCVRRAFDPWLDRCFDRGSFVPLDAANANLVETLRLEVDPVRFENEICAYAVHEHLIEHVGKEELFELSAYVAGHSGAFHKNLILFSVATAFDDTSLTEVGDLDERLTRLSASVQRNLDAAMAPDRMPPGDVMVGLLIADVGGLLLNAFCEPALIEAIRRRPCDGEQPVPVVSMEIFLAVWFDAVSRALDV